MTQWTPARHVRAIGEWPTLRSVSRIPSWRCYSVFSKGSVIERLFPLEREKKLRKHRFNAPSASPQWRRHSHSKRKRAGKERAAEEADSDGYTYQRQGDESDLPLPPFMRPAPQLRDKVRLMQQRRNTVKDRKLNYSPYTGPVGIPGPKPTPSWKAKDKSEFSLVFENNPYARMLGAPVRNCNISKAPMPRTCLVGFSNVEFTGDDGSVEPSLYPVSLAAEMVAKKKIVREGAMTVLEQKVYAAWEEDAQAFKQRGSNSYILAKREALDFVTKNHYYVKGQLTGPIMNLEMAQEKRRSDNRWPEEMAELVLEYNRSIVGKSFGRLLREKKVAEKLGGIQAVLGDDRLTRLNDTPNVMCVVRLGPPGAKTKGGEDVDAKIKEHGVTAENIAYATQGRNINGKRSPVAAQNTDSDAARDDITQDMPVPLQDVPSRLQDDTAETKGVEPLASSANEEPKDVQLARKDPLNGGETGLDESAETESQLKGPPSPRVREKSTTQVHRRGWWETEDPYWLRTAAALPPPENPSKTYFPTVHYHNRRVPLYDLPHLLGEELACKIVENTVFKGYEFVTIRGGTGIGGATIGAQIALFRLAAYLATDKASTPKIAT